MRASVRLRRIRSAASQPMTLRPNPTATAAVNPERTAAAAPAGPPPSGEAISSLTSSADVSEDHPRRGDHSEYWAQVLGGHDPQVDFVSGRHDSGWLGAAGHT